MDGPGGPLILPRTVRGGPILGGTTYGVTVLQAVNSLPDPSQPHSYVYIKQVCSGASFGIFKALRIFWQNLDDFITANFGKNVTNYYFYKYK